MDDQWLGFGKADLLVEKQQLSDEGIDLPEHLSTELENLLGYSVGEDEAYRSRIWRFLEQSAFLPVHKDYPFSEPSDLKSIQSARPATKHELPPLKLDAESYYDRIYGAWLGRCSGCLLGKPIEGLLVRDFWPTLKAKNQYPPKQYLDSSIAETLGDKYPFDTRRGFIDQIDHMVEDDDLNYTVAALAVMSEYGWNFSPDDVATFWLQNIPAYHTFTAERVAYRNFLLMKTPPESASYCNPFREWIGAQIRADFWGYVCPGDPARAAALAWRDACISHIKNGLYGAMWVAAMISAAVVCQSPRQALEAGLLQVPGTSRLNDCIQEVIAWYDAGVPVENAIRSIHQRWDDANPHHWCHTLSNAQIVTLGLLWGEGDFSNSISWAVTAGFDTDCNGATVGSVLGMLLGAKNLPSDWIAPLNDRLDTGLSGYHQVTLSEIAQHTLDLAKKSFSQPEHPSSTG